MSIVICPKCGAKNRVSEATAERLTPKCGRCGESLAGVAAAPQPPPGGRPVVVTDASFARDVLGAGATPVLLDCWAPWCGPCRQIAPIMDDLAAAADGRYVVAKLNTDENPRVAGDYRIDAIPTMLIFKNGKLVDRLVGLQPRQQIERKLAGHV